MAVEIGPALGLTADSSDLRIATTDLDRLAKKAGTTAAAANRTSGSLAAMAGSASRLPAPTRASASAMDDLASSAKSARAALASTEVAASNAAFESRNLSFQLIDVAQTIPLAFQSPLYALQNIGFQVAQIGQIYMGQGGLRAALLDSVGMIARFARYIGPVGVSVAALAGGVGLLRSEISETTGVAVSFGDTVKAVFQVAYRAVASLVTPIVETVAPAFSLLGDMIVSVTKWSVNTFITGWQAAIKSVQILYKGLVDGITFMSEGLVLSLKAVWLDIRGGFSSMVLEISEAWGSLVNGMASATSAVGISSISEPLQAAAKNIAAQVSEIQRETNQLEAKSDKLYATASRRFSLGAGLVDDAFNNVGFAIDRITSRDVAGSIFSTISEQAVANAKARLASLADGATEAAGRAGGSIKRIAFDVMGGVHRMTSGAKDSLSAMGDIAKDVAGKMQDAFADFLFNPFEGGLKGMLKSFTETIRKMAANLASSQLMNMFLGNVGKTGQIGGLLGSIIPSFSSLLGLGGGFATSAPMFGSWTTPFFHGGGVVGAGNAPAAPVPAMAFAGAPRLHGGGFIGPGETPAILRRGEAVLTPAQMARLGPAGGTTINNEFSITYEEAPGKTADERQQDQEAFGEVLRKQVVGALTQDLANRGPYSRHLASTFGLRRGGAA